MDENKQQSIPFKPVSTQDLNNLIKNPQLLNHIQQPIYKQQEMPKFERQTQEVKLIPEIKTKFETYIDDHKGAFIFWSFVISLITLAFVVFSWLNPIK